MHSLVCSLIKANSVSVRLKENFIKLYSIKAILLLGATNTSVIDLANLNHISKTLTKQACHVYLLSCFFMMNWKPLKSTRGETAGIWGELLLRQTAVAYCQKNTLTIVPAAIPNNERDRMPFSRCGKEVGHFHNWGRRNAWSVGQVDEWKRQQEWLLSLQKFSKCRAWQANEYYYLL